MRAVLVAAVAAILLGGAAQSPAARAPRTVTASAYAVTTLRDLPTAGEPARAVGPPRHLPRARSVSSVGPRRTAGLGLGPGMVPAPVRAFSGIIHTTALPSDPNLAVGTTQVVQMTNDGVEVLSKQGERLAGPVALHTLWSALGGPCGRRDDGDPVVIHDRAADRFVLTQFSTPGGSEGFVECVAVSRTPDATGAYALYAFRLSATEFQDYPKLATWSDSYWLTTLRFSGDQEAAFLGPGVFALERAALVAGSPGARLVQLDPGGVTDPILAVDRDGTVAPGAGEPAFLLASTDGPGADAIQVLRGLVDWSNPAAATLTRTTVAVPPFDSDLCGARDFHCAPQPGTHVRLDTIPDRLMFRASWRVAGGNETIVASQTVDVGGDHAGIRWYALRAAGSVVTVADHGDYAPDADARFMPAIASDRAGDIAIAYTVSGSVKPSMRYTARLAGDAPGTMRGERTAVLGAGVQTAAVGSGSSRWGDYSGLVVDPVDDCTFWATNQYLRHRDARVSTWIAAFRMPACPGAAGPDRSPPQLAPIAASAEPHAWTRSRWLTFSWPGAADEGTGVAGYSFVADHRPTTVPDHRVDTGRATVTLRLTRGRWWLHVRAVDRAGNWSDARHAGPFYVDPRCTMGGTDGPDVLVGSRRRDVICALAGNDVIQTGGGHDVIYAGPGNDTIAANDGAPDLIDGGAGRDRAVIDAGLDRTVRVERVIAR